MIVYGVAAEISIARLFIAGVVPGLMMVGLFMAYVSIWSSINSSKVPTKDSPLTFKENKSDPYFTTRYLVNSWSYRFHLFRYC